MLTYSYRLYPSDKEKYLVRDLDIACEIYNYCIAAYRMYYKLFGKTLSNYALQKHLTELKHTTKQHWNNLGSQAIQDVAQRVQRSYQAFFHQHRGYPHFRKRKNYRSFTLKQAGYKFQNDNEIIIQGHKFRYWKSREIEGNIKILTIKQMPSGKWFLFVVTDTNPVQNPTRTGKSVGIDFGLKNYMTFSNGIKIDSPQWYKQSLKQHRKLAREYSLKQDGSKNKQKAYHQLMCHYEHIVNQRRDWMFKLAKQLCEQYDFIAIEDLSIKGMQRHKHWGRKVSDIAWSEFVQILESQAKKYGTTILKIGRFQASTKVCHVCGQKVELSMDDREWTCPQCGTHHDRDINAAINIKQIAFG